MADQWLNSMVTDNAQEGFDLAIKMARMGVKYTQPSDEIRGQLRPVYGTDANALIASSHVIAVNCQTVAAANNYCRK